MLKLNSITFKDEETGKVIDVNVDGSIVSSQHITSDEYVCSSFYSSLIFSGGFKALIEFIDVNNKK